MNPRISRQWFSDHAESDAAEQARDYADRLRDEAKDRLMEDLWEQSQREKGGEQ